MKNVSKREMVRRLGRGKAEAIMLECEEKNISLLEFFLEIFNTYGAESLFAELFDLCEKYDKPVVEADDFSKGYYEELIEGDERYNAWKAFEARLIMTSKLIMTSND